jgi:hypothetical protein
VEGPREVEIRDEPGVPPPPLDVAAVAESGGRGRGFALLDPQLARHHRRWPA